MKISPHHLGCEIRRLPRSEGGCIGNPPPGRTIVALARGGHACGGSRHNQDPEELLPPRPARSLFFRRRPAARSPLTTLHFAASWRRGARRPVASPGSRLIRHRRTHTCTAYSHIGFAVPISFIQARRLSATPSHLPRTPAPHPSPPRPAPSAVFRPSRTSGPASAAPPRPTPLRHHPAGPKLNHCPML